MFSICIPNYNYEKYLGLTLDSIFAQSDSDFEVVLADNKSTDRSMAIMEEFATRNPGQVRYQINPANLGFAGNLDQAGRLAEREYMLMLSSDDTMSPEALGKYRSLLQQLPEGARPIITSAKSVIDGEGKPLEAVLAADMARPLWRVGDKDDVLSKAVGATVYKVEAKTMLHRCFAHMANPYNFLCTLYPRALYEQVGGYGGGRLINPDKWFHWKITAEADFVYFIDEPLFQYRWHANNQNAQQANSGHLKYLVDEYRSTMEVGPLLSAAGMTEDEFRRHFVHWDVMRHGLGELRKGLWLKSWRILHLGLGMYPGRVIKHRAFLPYLLLLALGPLGKALLRLKR